MFYMKLTFQVVINFWPALHSKVRIVVPRFLSRNSDSLRAGRFGVRTRWRQEVFYSSHPSRQVLGNLTFRGPCIVMYSYNESQRDALFVTFI
jgi:hypothetical protein